MSYHVSRIIESCSGLERGGSLVKILDANTWEDLEKPIPNRTVRNHVSNIIQLYFDKHLVISQAQILHGLIKHNKIKHATKILGFEDAKSRKESVNVIENISKPFSKIGKSRKLNVRASHRAITIAIVAPSTLRQRMVATMSKLLHVLRKTLHKHTKFRVWVDENDEVSCWDLITRKPYRDMLLVVIIPIVVEFWEIHSHAILDQKHVLWQWLSRGVYVEHAKYVSEIREVALFDEF